MNVVYNMAENITTVREKEKAVADGFEALTKLLNTISELKGKAFAIWYGIEKHIDELNKLEEAKNAS